MENSNLSYSLISELANDFTEDELPVVVECAQKVAHHLKRNIDQNQTSSSTRILSERQAFVQQIIDYCAISDTISGN